MSDIRDPHPLLHQAREVAAALALRGDNERLLAKINALLALSHLHGGQQITLERLIAQARALK